MTSLRLTSFFGYIVLFLLGVLFVLPAGAEDDENYLSEENTEKISEPPPSTPSSQTKNPPQKRKYFTEESHQRVDSGVFHVAIAGGGNFYIEPVYQNEAPTGEYWKDFGFQAGVYFDWDYSELDENIPLGLRGMVGYKYILSSVHVFTFDGMIRRMWRFSEKASFGLGFGGSAAVWYREQVINANGNALTKEETVFLPSFIVGAGFDFPPFITDFKILINRWAADVLIAGFELYFGFRL